MPSKSTLFKLSLALAASMTASATTISFDLGGVPCANPSAGICTPIEGAQASQINFDSATAPSPFVDGAATFTFAPGNVSPFVEGSLSGQYAAPPNDSTRYLSVGSPGRAGSLTIDFDSPINYYGLYLGSPDDYNVFSFFETGNNQTPLASFTGNTLVPPGQGNQSIGQYINFYVHDGTISRIVLSSNQAALESDNHAYKVVPGADPGEVPEPATMGLMGSALVGIAFFVRRRQSK